MMPEKLVLKLLLPIMSPLRSMFTKPSPSIEPTASFGTSRFVSDKVPLPKSSIRAVLPVDDLVKECYSSFAILGLTVKDDRRVACGRIIGKIHQSPASL